jgi:hypothetical protein
MKLSACAFSSVRRQINTKLVSRLTTVVKDFEEGSMRDAINCLGGLERRIYAIRSLLLLTL